MTEITPTIPATVEPSAIPTVQLDMSTIISSTQQIAAVELDAWRDGQTSQFFIAIGIVPLVLTVALLLILGARQWRSV